MKSTVEQLNPVQYRVHVEISPEEVNQAFDGVFRRMQKRAHIQGFRPGKAPITVIKKLYGGQASAEVHEDLIKTHLFSALEAQTIRPIASPVVEAKQAPASNAPFNFSAVVDILPALAFDDYKGVAAERETFAVKDETVTRELDLLRRRHARTRPVEDGTVAADGLLAAIAHKGRLEGNELPNMTVDNLAVYLGAKELFEGLEKEILGMKVGETKNAAVALPADYGDGDLAGQTVDFELTLKDLKHLDLPALDDEFAKDLDYLSVAELSADVRKRLEARFIDHSRQKLEGAILDKILADHPFEVPPAMVDQVIDSMISEMGFKSTEEKNRAMHDQELRKHFLPTARRRTQNTLILWHVSQKEGLSVADGEIEQRAKETIAGMGIDDPKTAARYLKQLEPRLRENMIFEKAMEFLIKNAVVTDTARDI